MNRINEAKEVERKKGHEEEAANKRKTSAG